MKIDPPLKMRPPPFSEWSCCKGSISLKVHPTIYAAVCIMLTKKHWSSIVQEEGLTIEGRHNLLLLHEQVHDKEALQNHCMRT